MREFNSDIFFDEIYHLYKNKVFGYAMKICHSKSIAEDITQEVFIQLWIHRDSLKFVENLNGFIYTIVFRKSLNILRKAKYDEKLLQGIEQSIQEYKEEKQLLESSIEFKNILQIAIQQLTTQKRNIFILSKEYGLSYKEISEQLNISPNTVKNHLIEALKSIRKYLISQNVSIQVLLLFALY